MGMRKRLKEGDFVTIVLPSDNDVRITQGMMTYDGLRTTVSKAKKIEYNDIYNKKHFGYIYELAGIKSMMGVPYTFTRDMLCAFGKEG